MPSKTIKKELAAVLPSIPKEIVDQMVSGPMSAEAILAASMAFKKALIERLLGAELSHHLGYPPGAEKPVDGDNHRHGASGKTVLTEDGPLRIDVPRDRQGRFEPLLIPKHERRFTGFDDKIVAMYAGMTFREIQGFLAEQYGTEVSPDFRCRRHPDRGHRRLERHARGLGGGNQADLYRTECRSRSG